MQKLVSVNITTYNRSELLKRAIASVQRQTYKNLEIIVVDDFSSDNTSELLAEMKKNDNRIKVIRHTSNKRLANARNTALDASNGEFIAFMDDDDEWIAEKKIEHQVNFLEKNRNIDLVCSSVTLLQNSNGQFKNKIIREPKDLKLRLLIGNGLIYSPTVVARRKMIEEVGKFNPDVKRGVDSDLYRRCILCGKKIGFMSDVTTAIYEYGNDRMTNSDSEEKSLIHIESQFQKLGLYGDLIPKKAKSKILENIASQYYNIYKHTSRLHFKKEALLNMEHSLKNHYFNYSALLKYIYLKTSRS